VALQMLQFIFLSEITAVEGVGSFLSMGNVLFYHVSGIICGATTCVSTVTYCMLQCPQTCIFRSNKRVC
jgi:hypothetical protein